MRRYIHEETIKKFFEDKYDEEIVDRVFKNRQTKETYHVLANSETDIAFFTVNKEGEHICLNSDGEPVESQKIYGYINGEYTSEDYYGNNLYQIEKLNLQYQEEEISRDSIIECEKDLYPKRTNIRIPAILGIKNFHVENRKDFLVNKVMKISNEQFDEIIAGRDSEAIQQYNQKRYEPIEGTNNGVVFINEQGDGVLVDPQGYNYARYLCFAPKIQIYIDKQIEQEMEQNATLEMKLYVPLKITKYEAGHENEEIEVDGIDYYQEIREEIQRANLVDGKRGLASHLHKEELVEKVFAIKPDIELEYENNQLVGVAEIKMVESLTDSEIQELKDYCARQFETGWGKSFEQRKIDIMDGEIFVHFWQASEEYKVMTDEEMEALEQNPLQGMTGMNM